MANEGKGGGGKGEAERSQRREQAVEIRLLAYCLLSVGRMPLDFSSMTTLERLQKPERRKPIEGWNIHVYDWSRNPWILAVASGVVLLAGIALGWVYRAPEALEPKEQPLHGAGFLRELARPAPDLRKVARELEFR